MKTKYGVTKLGALKMARWHWKKRYEGAHHRNGVRLWLAVYRGLTEVKL